MSYLSVNPYVLNLIPLFNVADPTNGGTTAALGTTLSNLESIVNAGTQTISIATLVPPANGTGTITMNGNVDITGTLTVGGVPVGADLDGSNFIYGENITLSTGTTSLVLSNTTVANQNAFSFITGGTDVLSIDGSGRALYKGNGVSSNTNRLWVSSAILHADRAAVNLGGSNTMSTIFDVWNGDAYFDSNIHIGGTAYSMGGFVNLSDRRLKRDIRPVEGALSTVCALQGVHYTIGREPTFGFIAQDVREVVPDAVRETPGGLLAVDYQSLLPIVVEAVKELARRI